MPAHHLPPVEGDTGARWSDLIESHHRIPPLSCCRTHLQILTFVYKDLSFRSWTTLPLTLSTLNLFPASPEALGCYPFSYFHTTFWFLHAVPWPHPPFTLSWGFVMFSTTQTASGELGSWKGEAKSRGFISIFLGWLAGSPPILPWGAGHHTTMKHTLG